MRAFTNVTAAEEGEIQGDKKNKSYRDILLLSKSRSIHLLEKVHVEINPELLRESNLNNEVSKNVKFNDNEDQENVELPKLDKNSEEVEFIQYAPRLFYDIRREDQIKASDLWESFDPYNNKESAFKAGEGEGKGGCFFFFTFDHKFLIKTMTKGEHDAFMDFLPSYYNHCIKEKMSLFAKIYGVFQLKLPGLTPVYFFLMENCLTYNGNNLIRVYDLKGSTVNREVPEHEEYDEISINKDASRTRKDVNFKRDVAKKELVK